ncbi:LytTR family DNA-binding domain-containing protein [Xanthocytophaga flavus]|nr:LytTR family DNA-binding domain-containing protein [Xanthocytophaga flavus]
MMTAIVIDDEPIALEIIRSLSGKVAFIEFEAYFANAFEAVDFLQKNKVDLLFLDIKMPDISGIEFLQSLASPPMVIFTTAYSEHAVQSFELDAIDYLLKPFSLSRFLKACTKAHEQYELRKNNVITPPVTSSIFIKSGYEQIRVALDEIWYVESSGNYMKFVLEKQKIASRLTMSEAEALLPVSDFIRIHRSFIVSKKQVVKVDKRSVWIRQTELPIGAAYVHEIEKIFQ